jgi:hypothetical protein
MLLPWPLEVDRPPPTAKAKFFKNLFGPWGGPPFGRGVGLATLDQLAWVASATPLGQTVALGCGPATPRATKKKVLFYYLFFKILNNI